MLTSIATVSVSGRLEEKLKAIAGAGFRGVEIFDPDFVASPLSAREVGAMARDLGLELTLFQPFRDFEGLPEPLRARAFDRAERKFDVMGEMGVDTLLVCSSVSPAALPGLDRAAEDFHALGDRAARRGIRIGYEALAWGVWVNDHRDAWEIVRRADHPSVGLILDSFHTLSRNIPVASIAMLPKEKLFLVQLADAPRLSLDILSWSRHFRNMPGQGDLDVLGFMKAVAATGYDGAVSLEIFNDQFRASSAAAVALDGHRSLIHLIDQVHEDAPRAIGRPGTALAPAVPVVETRLPPRSQVKGIEFIEFAMAEGDVDAFERLLAALGFHRAGRHRSKQVTLWHQGQINLVVNSDPNGFAHAFQLNHGPSVCAIGLKVDDAQGVKARAIALLADGFDQQVHQGELNIPAIRGIGGSLIYFVDDKSQLKDLWSVDFIPEPGAVAAGGESDAAVDHVSWSTHHDEMLSWILFYTSIFDITRLPAQEIADPQGLVRSEVLETKNDALRLVLNGPHSMRTLVGRFVEESFGSGVQHMAFRTGDIFAMAARMRSHGVPVLPISKNYYDDIAARFGLSDGMVAKLAKHSILYDRDDDGEFFQIYTMSMVEETFKEDRFFFEIVERRDYAGFGAPNAAVRLAAQTRLARHPKMPVR